MKRIAVVDRKKCVGAKCGYVCQKVCPGVKMGDETITIDDRGYPVISELLCTGCGICVKKCPVDAITVVNLPTEEKTPVYQYGVNAFRLYNLPLPGDGVTGFVGKNGIGKSTAIKLLTGILKPNFGEYDKEWKWNEILEKMNNVERAYFSKIVDNTVRVSYKPQHVDKLTSSFDGTVKEFLEKVNPKRVDVSVVIKEFSLEKLLNRKFNTLSGGEVQRIVIAAAYMKDADFYFFDDELHILKDLKVAYPGKAHIFHTPKGVLYETFQQD